LELGGDDFVRKPFTRREVMARIHPILRRSHPEATATTFPLGDLTIHPKALLAKRGEHSIDLTPREVAILQLLHKHAGEPVSRDSLLDDCWGRDYFPDSRTLDQHIHQLRKKIEPDPANPTLIETVRGIGYRTPSSLRPVV
jgi:DNA-binding response OmpR family regulator